MFGNYAMRAAIGVAIAAIVMIVMGIGETYRCLRTLLPPSTLTLTEVSAGELAGRGYVRVTDVRADMERVGVKVRTRRGQPTGEWEGAYVGVVDASAGPDGGGMCNLVAWLPHAREEADIAALQVLPGEGGDELIGFVDGKYDPLSPHRYEKLISAVRTDPKNCWIVDVRRPSWLKGLGFTLVGLAIPTGFVLWKRKQPVGQY